MDEAKENPDWIQYWDSIDSVLKESEQNEEVFGFPRNVKLDSDSLSAFNGKASFYYQNCEYSDELVDFSDAHIFL